VLARVGAWATVWAWHAAACRTRVERFVRGAYSGGFDRSFLPPLNLASRSGRDLVEDGVDDDDAAE
jgi:hypothetical protein